MNIHLPKAIASGKSLPRKEIATALWILKSNPPVHQPISSFTFVQHVRCLLEEILWKDAVLQTFFIIAEDAKSITVYVEPPAVHDLQYERNAGPVGKEYMSEGIRVFVLARSAQDGAYEVTR